LERFLEILLCHCQALSAIRPGSPQGYKTGVFSALILFLEIRSHRVLFLLLLLLLLLMLTLFISGTKVCSIEILMSLAVGLQGTTTGSNTLTSKQAMESFLAH
jgi:hypothetical protein